MSRPDPSNEATVIRAARDPRRPGAGPCGRHARGARAVPVDRLDDVLLVSDAIAAHGPAHADDDAGLQVHIRTPQDALVLRIGPLAPDGGSGLLAAADAAGRGQHRSSRSPSR